METEKKEADRDTKTDRHRGREGGMEEGKRKEI